MQCQKLTINVGEVELFIEVYDKQTMPEENIKVGDTSWYNVNGVLKQHVWFGPEEKWVVQDSGNNIISNINAVAERMVSRPPEEIIIRVLNSDPEFDKEEYVSKGE